MYWINQSVKSDQEKDATVTISESVGMEKAANCSRHHS